jgi:hypothetical protein
MFLSDQPVVTARTIYKLNLLHCQELLNLSDEDKQLLSNSDSDTDLKSIFQSRIENLESPMFNHPQ